MESIFKNMDCIAGMKEYPDKYFDLAIVDPPYGGASKDYDATTQRYGGRFDKYFEPNNSELGCHFHGRGRSKKYQEIYQEQNPIDCERTGRSWAKKYGNNICDWDVAPSQEYFDELFRVSKNQIIWGGNYFTLPPTRCFVIWKNLLFPKTLLWLCVSMLGLLLTITQKYSSMHHKTKQGFTRHKNP